MRVTQISQRQCWNHLLVLSEWSCCVIMASDFFFPVLFQASHLLPGLFIVVMYFQLSWPCVNFDVSGCLHLQSTCLSWRMASKCERQNKQYKPIKWLKMMCVCGQSEMFSVADPTQSSSTFGKYNPHRKQELFWKKKKPPATKFRPQFIVQWKSTGLSRNSTLLVKASVVENPGTSQKWRWMKRIHGKTQCCWWIFLATKFLLVPLYWKELYSRVFQMSPLWDE